MRCTTTKNMHALQLLPNILHRIFSINKTATNINHFGGPHFNDLKKRKVLPEA